MGSAFTPVAPRRASTSSNSNSNVVKPGRRPSNKRTRQNQSTSNSNNNNLSKNLHPSSLFHMNVVDECDEDEAATLETVPDHLSSTASETSSKASNNSQPPLLDFIGQTCMASAWFTSCFPCAVVDINDSDTYVVDRLSRESAMNVMYANSNLNGGNAGGGGSVDGSAASNSLAGGRRTKAANTIQKKGSDQEKNMMFVRLPDKDEGQAPQSDNGNGIPPIQSMPSVIQEGSEDDDADAMEEVSLDEDDGYGDDRSHPLRVDSGIVSVDDDGEILSVISSISAATERPIYKPHGDNPPTKMGSKKFSVRKMFGRKKK